MGTKQELHRMKVGDVGTYRGTALVCLEDPDGKHCKDCVFYETPIVHTHGVPCSSVCSRGRGTATYGVYFKCIDNIVEEL